ncbi:molybdenum cofactor guanylyltransferase MobA [soil metagenome]
MSGARDVAGVILAGGRASRMGGLDKALLPLAGRPMLGHVIARLAPQVGALVLNANRPAEDYAAFGLDIVPDSIAGHAGPLAGILAGMDWAAARGFPLVASAAADPPFFPATLVADLRAAMEREAMPLAMAITPDPERGLSRHPTFGLWSVALRGELRGALAAGERKIIGWTEPRGCARAIFPDDSFPFFNVNTPGDLVRAHELLASLR